MPAIAPELLALVNAAPVFAPPFAYFAKFYDGVRHLCRGQGDVAQAMP